MADVQHFVTIPTDKVADASDHGEAAHVSRPFVSRVSVPASASQVLPDYAPSTKEPVSPHPPRMSS